VGGLVMVLDCYLKREGKEGRKQVEEVWLERDRPSLAPRSIQATRVALC
jgi:hypothetical protein